MTAREAQSSTAAEKANDAWLRRASEGMSTASMTVKSTPRVSIKTVIVGVCGAGAAVAGAGAMGGVAVIMTVREEVLGAGAVVGAGAAPGATAAVIKTVSLSVRGAGAATAGAGTVGGVAVVVGLRALRLPART